jgi:hypothetical protein
VALGAYSFFFAPRGDLFVIYADPDAYDGQVVRLGSEATIISATTNAFVMKEKKGERLRFAQLSIRNTWPLMFA